MKQLLKQFYDNPAVHCLTHKQTGLGNLNSTEEALLIAAAYQKQPRNILIVKQNLYDAKALADRLMNLTDANVHLFGVEESLRVEAIAASPEMQASQIETLAAIQTNQPSILITHTAGAMRFLCSPKQFQAHTVTLKQDDEMDLETLKQLLYEAGYHPVARVDQPLCFASRGGIVDVYSMNNDHPVRIEFFDNLIESIRFFDITTQRTISIVNEIQLVPATQYLLTDSEKADLIQEVHQALQRQCSKLSDHLQEKLRERVEQDLEILQNGNIDGSLYRYFGFLKQPSTILDYMEQPLVIFSSEEEVKQSYQRIQEESIAYIQELSQEGLALSKFTLYADLFQIAIKKEHMYIGMFQDQLHPVSSQIMTQIVGDLSFERIMEQVMQDKSDKCVVLCLQKKEIEIATAYLTNHNVSYTCINDFQYVANKILIWERDLFEGFVCLKENISVYTSKELFHVQKKQMRYANKFKEAEELHDYMDLSIGDYVVHSQHGVGKYVGIENREVNGIHKDFLKIVYKGDDILYVPLEQFQLIRKFLSKEGTQPKLNKLGSDEWSKTKRKVSEKVAELAERLIHLYAQREDSIGYAFSKDTPFQREFEDDFPYELTKDQKRSVQEIKKDMEAHKPMDRLLCGDVGFGKTEVAIRAAFKAVIDQKQVAFLCPTTILSLQHFQTFKNRFAHYPVTIEVINRFVPSQKVAQIKKGLKDGTIDILIGTHRLLSKDIEWKDLGFLVIDEEQRFGVEHKEKIKELRSSVDVLSMSATPIPRTLQMSLVGIRALSQLDTPPMNRMPVQTYVIEKDDQVIKEVIQRELVRNGQVFYLFNNVKEIYQVARKLQNDLPDITIAVAHGKMSREEIEDVMMAFTQNQYQVLICTTIIETGIDIPNANTIIIDQADRFGLSQLYQIKGRVGRSDRLAYAYLMYSSNKQLNENAAKRLKAIKEFTQLGSGYKIAMRDLTIRGAGDMLGPQQAGFIDTVGMDMYIEMLNEAIHERMGKPKEETVEKKSTNMQLDAYIPSSFAPKDFEKITLYQRIEAISTKQELLAFMEEIKDNYGKLPNSVQLLFEKKRLDLLYNEPHIIDFKELSQEIRLVFSEEWSNQIDGVKLFEMMTTVCKDAKIHYAMKKISMHIPKSGNWLPLLIEILERTLRMERRV
ncbi:MAG: transcription-repair coupling factor [Erysipelotrichaceae bacterium]|nr:transcription-repair coupling factor [Erysipelotrichaceae bacterium]